MTAIDPRFGLFEDFGNLPALGQPADRQPPPRLVSPRERAIMALLAACELLARRGPEPHGWATPFRHDPVAFLLDSVNDAVTLWGPDGAVVYSNRAAKEIGRGRSDDAAPKDFVKAGRRYQRRCARVEYQSVEYVLEVLREVSS